jgi:MerR family copper efflux transcriptional regulator
MRTGQLAKCAGVNVQTLRFYEREGLLPQPARTRSGYRQYQRRDLHRVQFIKSCQETGFTLNDVREIFELHRVLAAPTQERGIKPRAQKIFLAAATRRLGVIDDKLRTLKKMKREMRALVATLGGHLRPVCPVSGLPVA